MNNWKKYLLLTVSIAFSLPVAKWLYACAGGEDPYDYFASFFLNDINKDPAYQPFRYTSYLTYYDEWWQPKLDKDTVLSDQNISEWESYIRSNVKQADIDSFVYRFAYKDLKTLYNNMDKGTAESLPAAVRDNSMTQWFRSSKDLEALGYLMFAKQCEPQVSNGGDAWHTPDRDSAKTNRLIKNGLQLHAAAKKDFFQWRYAFQVLRLAFYSGQYERTLALYEQLVGNKTAGSYIYARVLGLKAGALYRTGKKQQAAYLYSRVFDLSDNTKRSAHISFNWAVNADSRKVLPLCKNDHEKAVVYIMDGLYRREADKQTPLEVMQKAYELEPQIRGLDVVMTRAINQLEEAFLDEKLRQERNIYSLSGYEYGFYYGAYDEEGKTRNKDKSAEYRATINELAAFAGQVAQAGNNGAPVFWYLAQAYLFILNQQPDEAYAALQQAGKQNLAPRQKDQANIIRALYYVYQKPTLTAASEQELLPLMEWLESRKEADSRLDNVYRYLLNGVLAHSYLQQKDTAKFVLALSKLLPEDWSGEADREGRPADVAFYDFKDEPGRLLQEMSMERLTGLKTFVATKGRSAFDRWLINNNLYAPALLSEMEGTRYLRMLDFPNAVRTFEQLPPAMLRHRLLPDPFVLHISDRQRWDKHDSANTYTKLRFAQEMAKLQQEVKLKPGDASKAFLYGLGLYSMTHYGRAAYAFTYYRSGTDDNAYFDTRERQKLPADFQNYYGAIAAAQMFQAAADAATDPELKAKCIYMLAKCWQKNIADPPRDKYGFTQNPEMNYYRQSLTNPYFAQLKAFQNTDTYKTAATRCSYLKDYIRKK